MTSNNIYTPIKPTYLYIKQHSITGLKYLGKTTRDPYKYLGSGKHWIRHYKKHGKEHIKNIWVSKQYIDKELLSEFALFISEEYDIVESEEWANLKPENGLDGGINTKGMATVRDSSGNCFQVQINDPRIKSGELVGVNKGKTNPGNNKGKVAAKFSNTEMCIQVDKDDPRLQTGELVGVAKGITYKHKKARTLEHSKTISESKKGIPSKKKGIPSGKKGIVQENVTCPYCNKIGRLSPMKRWHFDNCKYNLQSFYTVI